MQVDRGPWKKPAQAYYLRGRVIVVSQVSSVECAELGERIGMLSTRRVEQVFDGLRFQQASFFNR